MITRKAAKAEGLGRYFTGKPCIHGHISERYVSTKACIACLIAHDKKWKSNNRKKCRASDLEYYVLNREDIIIRKRRYYEQHPNKRREATRKWSRRNPGARRATQAKRRAKELKSLPIWADLNAIKSIYCEAKRKGLTVDHIVPLQSNIVCGLHVEHNLQLLTQSQNSSKKNYHNL